jgi:thioesterase DpgC
VPTREGASGRTRTPKGQRGYEIDRGLFLSQILSHAIGRAPGPRHAAAVAVSARRSRRVSKTDRLDIGSTTVERHGQVGYLYHGNPRFLNAEDDSTTRSLERGVD